MSISFRTYLKRISSHNREDGYSPYYHLYVLKLEHGKYYVGISKNFRKRYEAHELGEGAEWTKIHKPIKVISNKELPFYCYTEIKPYEDSETISQMKKYGRENVRGGIYCAVNQDIVDRILGERLCKEIDAAVLDAKEKAEQKKKKQEEKKLKARESKPAETKDKEHETKKKRYASYGPIIKAKASSHLRNSTYVELPSKDLHLREKMKGYEIVAYDAGEKNSAFNRGKVIKQRLVAVKRGGGRQVFIFIDFNEKKIYVTKVDMQRFGSYIKEYFSV